MNAIYVLCTFHSFIHARTENDKIMRSTFASFIFFMQSTHQTLLVSEREVKVSANDPFI